MHNLLSAILLVIGFALPQFAQAQHAHHNMVLYGQGENFYASHIVYKVPHNYQVILKLNLSFDVRATLNKEMNAYPTDQFIYLLNHMDIGQITQQPAISGQVFRRTADGSKQILFSTVALQPSDYSIVYFSELPLSLEPEKYSTKIKLLREGCAKDDQRPQCCLPISNC